MLAQLGYQIFPLFIVQYVLAAKVFCNGLDIIIFMQRDILGATVR